jgi:hypothetical protein
MGVYNLSLWDGSSPILLITSPSLVSNSKGPYGTGSQDGTETGYVSIVGIVQMLDATSTQYDQHTLLEPGLTIREHREHRSIKSLVAS